MTRDQAGMLPFVIAYALDPVVRFAVDWRATMGRVLWCNVVCLSCGSRCGHDHPTPPEARRCEQRSALTDDTTYGPFTWCRCEVLA